MSGKRSAVSPRGINRLRRRNIERPLKNLLWSNIGGGFIPEPPPAVTRAKKVGGLFDNFWRGDYSY